MSQPFIAEVKIFAGNFAPRGWAFCDGQLLAISSNTALFSILGTTYGGDGRTTFALPDLRSRVPIHVGQGPGLSSYRLGEKGGAETVKLTTQQLPAHNHTVRCSRPKGTSIAPLGFVPATTPGDQDYGAPSDPAHLMASDMITPTGTDEAHPNRQPYNCVSYIIALVGVFPSRN